MNKEYLHKALWFAYGYQHASFNAISEPYAVFSGNTGMILFSVDLLCTPHDAHFPFFK